jgi:hypothetical protein
MDETRRLALPVSTRASIDTRKAVAPSAVHSSVTGPGDPSGGRTVSTSPRRVSPLCGIDSHREPDRLISPHASEELQLMTSGRRGIGDDAAPRTGSRSRDIDREGISGGLKSGQMVREAFVEPIGLAALPARPTKVGWDPRPSGEGDNGYGWSGVKPSVSVCRKRTRAFSSASERPSRPTRFVLMLSVDSGAGQHVVLSPGSPVAQRGSASRVL